MKLNFCYMHLRKKNVNLASIARLCSKLASAGPLSCELERCNRVFLQEGRAS